jgi:hypothetical protein
MGNTQIQFFAAAIMPLFAIMALLLLLDLAIAHRRAGYLLALVATRYMTKRFLGGLIDDGYVDVAILFFFFLPLHALMKATSQEDAALRLRYTVLGGVFCAGAALTKQSGLYIFALWPVLSYVLGCYREGERNRRRELLAVARTLGVASLIALPWYGWSLVSVALGTNVSSVELMQELPLYSLPLLERLRQATLTLEKYNLLFLLSLAALPLLERRLRWILLGVGIPYALIWAVFLSYDTRNLAPVIPVISLSAGMGLEAIVARMEPLAARLRLSRIPGSIVIGAGIAGLLVWGASVRDRELLDRQDALLRRLWYPALNEQIYARAEQVPGGLFLTNYRMDFLPGLADVTLVDHLQDWEAYTDLVNGNPEIRTILLSKYVNEQIMADVRLGVEEGRYGLIAEMGDWIMVDVPRSP